MDIRNLLILYKNLSEFIKYEIVTPLHEEPDNENIDISKSAGFRVIDSCLYKDLLAGINPGIVIETQIKYDKMKVNSRKFLFVSGRLLYCGILILIWSCSNSRLSSANTSNAASGFPVNMMQPVSYLNVRINDNFWAPRIEKNRIAGIPGVFKEGSQEIDNFDIASGKRKGKRIGQNATDSDIFKIIQGATYSLHQYRDPELEKFVDSLIDGIVAAQQADGYLNTYFIINDSLQKWGDLRKTHELYVAGHMFEGAAAHYEATGKRKFLDAAIRLADLTESIFGPGKRLDVPGHEEVELGLIKLYQATGEKRFLEQAKFFIGERGNPERIAALLIPPEHDPNANTPRRWRAPSYSQDHLPLKDQHEAEGHAVRAAYLYAAATEVSAITQSDLYVPALNDIWSDIVNKKMYITGGVGTSIYRNEGFKLPWEIPNDKAYQETCSSIGMIFWNRRMNWLQGDGRYADLAELIMYNAGISGVSLSGDRFFYTNPIVSDGKRQRSAWFDPACCPSSIVRFLPEIGSTIYAKDEAGIYINQFIGNEAKILLNQNEINVQLETSYPWVGNVKLKIDPSEETSFKINIRIPAWARGQYLQDNELYQFLKEKASNNKKFKLSVNGKKVHPNSINKGYVSINRKWSKGDVVELELPMQIHAVTANPKLVDTRGKIALMRGPVVYCLEETDNSQYFNKGQEPLLYTSGFTSEYKKDLLSGIAIIHGKAKMPGSSKDISVTAVPYYSWANRTPGKMEVWIPAKFNNPNP